MRPETLSARITEALDAGAPTATLGALYFECYGQNCHQRPRLEHFLRQYASQHPASSASVPARPTGKPKKPSPVAYKFKDFAKDFSAIVTQADGSLKEVHAGNVTDYDAEYLIGDGKGHLLEEVSADEAEQASKAAKPTLSTRTSGQQVAAAPTLVPLLVPAPVAPNNDAQQHDEAELKAREKQAQAEQNQPEQPDLKVAVVPDPTAGAPKPEIAKK